MTTAFLNYDKKDDQVGEMMEHLRHFQKVQRIALRVLNPCKLMQYVSSPLLQKKESDVWMKDYAYIAVTKAIELEAAQEAESTHCEDQRRDYVGK